MRPLRAPRLCIVKPIPLTLVDKSILAVAQHCEASVPIELFVRYGIEISVY
jgi:hypothetical protein